MLVQLHFRLGHRLIVHFGLEQFVLEVQLAPVIFCMLVSLDNVAFWCIFREDGERSEAGTEAEWCFAAVLVFPARLTFGV